MKAFARRAEPRVGGFATVLHLDLPRFELFPPREALPGKIEALEGEQSAITAALADPAVYRDQPDRVHALQSRYSAIEAELMQSLARWEELEARQVKS